MEYKIGSRLIGGKKLFFTVEEGQANLGDMGKALRMIEAASFAGADAIEFQLAIADDFYVKNNPGYGIYKKREFTPREIKKLVDYTKKNKLEFIAVPFSQKLVKILREIGVSAFNINASDITNPAIIDEIAISRLPFFLSIPLATEAEIEWAVSRIRKLAAGNFAILHGQHIMASGKGVLTAEKTSLGYLSSIKKRYGIPVGFIDHTPLSWMPSAAVAAGADVVAKHLAISRMDKGPDWYICLEPEEMKKSIETARKMKTSMNSVVKKLLPGELRDRPIMRRSIVAARNLKKGLKISVNDLLFKRPGSGLSPTDYSKISGKTLVHDLAADELFSLKDVKGN